MINVFTYPDLVFQVMYVGKIKITFILILIFLGIINPSPVLGIVKRNDKSIPLEPIPTNTSTLINNLEELRKLNDPVVNSYINAIEEALNRGDYDEANRLLADLQNYLQLKYGGSGTGNPELDKAISYIMSIKSVENNTVYLDLVEYLENLSKYTNSTDTEKLLEKIKSGELNNTDIDELSKILGSITNTSRLFNFSFPKSNPLQNKPPQFQPLPSAPVGSAPNIGVIPEWIGYIVLLSIILGIIYIYRQKIASLFRPLTIKTKKTLLLLTTRIKRINDPVASLLYEYIVVASSYGFKKHRWETLREFLSKIKLSDLKSIGNEIIKLYEDKFYGGKNVDISIIAELRSKIKSIGGSR